MNKTEKKAFEMLSDEEKEQVSGGATIDEETELTDKQCKTLSERLRKKKRSLSFKPPVPPGFHTIEIAYGCHIPREPHIMLPDIPIAKPVDSIKSPLENQEQTDIEK